MGVVKVIKDTRKLNGRGNENFNISTNDITKERMMKVEERIKPNEVIHITHNDTDGVGCAVVATMMLNTGSIINKDPELNWTRKFCWIGQQDAALVDALQEVKAKYDDPNALPGRILITDISVSDETVELLEDLRHKGVIVLGFDHHASNKIQKGWFTVIVDTVPKWSYNDAYESPNQMVSATYLVYDHFRNMNNSFGHWPNTNMSGRGDRSACEYARIWEYGFVQSISRYDTFTFTKTDSDLVNDVITETDPRYSKSSYVSIPDTFWLDITSMMGPEETFEVMMDIYSPLYGLPCASITGAQSACRKIVNTLKDKYFMIYDLIQKQKEEKINYIKTHAKLLELYGERCGVFMGGSAADSIAANKVLNCYKGFIDVAVILYPETAKVGLRSLDDGPDVGTLATSIGGGGHMHASGAYIGSDEFCDILKSYHKAPKLVAILEEANAMLDEVGGDDLG